VSKLLLRIAHPYITILDFHQEAPSILLAAFQGQSAEHGGIQHKDLPTSDFKKAFDLPTSSLVAYSDVVVYYMAVRVFARAMAIVSIVIAAMILLLTSIHSSYSSTFFALVEIS